MEKINTEEINKRITEHYTNQRRLRQDMVSTIAKMLEEMGGKISLTDKQYDDTLCVTYDGGFRIGCVCEEVKSISTYGDEDFCIEVEDECNAESSRIIFDDVCAICDVVSSRYNNFNKNIGHYKEVLSILLANKNGLKAQMNLTYNDELDIVKQFGEPIDLETLENPACVEVKSYLYVDVLGNQTIAELRDSDEKFSKYQNIVANLMKAKKPQYIIGAKDGIVQGLLWCEF